MKEPVVMPVAEVLSRWTEFDAVIDARSPAEHAEDHLPGAISAPVLDDDERARVGLLYSQSAFEAKRLGAAIVARNIGDIVDRLFAGCGRTWRPLVYCWRGGNRSGSLATVMARIGWHTTVLEGGYRSFRRHVVEALASLPSRHHFIVVAGRTGTAKSRLLQRLAARGAQVLDLEALACHRGSVLGNLPDAAQPSQKHFETRIWERLAAFDPARPVFVESESRKVGRCQVPEALILAIRASRCVRIESEVPARAAFLLEEYQHFVADGTALQAQLELLRPLHGGQRLDAWQSLVQAGQWPEVVARLLAEHYDPAYDRSMSRNYANIDAAPVIVLRDMGEAALEAAAEELLAVTACHRARCARDDG
jgi:tRNA 2-selenouridine synthase